MSRSLIKMRKTILVFAALSVTCVCSAGNTVEKPVHILQTNLVETFFSEQAKSAIAQVLQKQNPTREWDVTTIRLETIVGLDQQLLPQDVQNEIVMGLQRVGLSFSLNEQEISVYRTTGIVPPVSNHSRIGRLPLTPMAYFALRSEGIETVQQMSRLPKSKKAADPRSANASIPSAPGFVSDFASLSPRTHDALVNHGIWGLSQLAAMTEHELKFVHRLGALGVEEIRALFLEKKLPWYRDKLEKALVEKIEDAPLDSHFGIPWRLTQHWQVTSLKQLLERLDGEDAVLRAGGQTSQTALRLKAIVDQHRAKCSKNLQP
jgi:hypothetical protein